MGKKLFVGNLSYKIDEEGLKDVFSKVGAVDSVKIIIDNATGRSKGFGFVEMATDEDATKAITDLNGSMLMERAITVSEARPQREKGGRPSGRGGRGGFDKGSKTGGWR